MKKVQTLALLLILFFPILKSRAAGEDSASFKIKPPAASTSQAKNNHLKITEEKVKIGESKIRVVVSRNEKAGTIYFRPHENEATASKAAAEIIKKRGGVFVELKSAGSRNIGFTLKNKKFSFDPNRIFTLEGIEKTIGNDGGNTRPEAIIEVSKFTDVLFRRFLTDKKLIVAVHNNTNGGQLSIETYKNNPDAADVHINKNRDPDDFFYVTDKKHFEILKNKNFNVILQDNENAADDGSLSIYCGKNDIAYINVESEHGHLRQQIEMLYAIQDMIKPVE